jgi:hypothetical protein
VIAAGGSAGVKYDLAQRLHSVRGDIHEAFYAIEQIREGAFETSNHGGACFAGADNEDATRSGEIGLKLAQCLLYERLWLGGFKGRLPNVARVLAQR